MNFGFNSNVRIGKTVYHVQTEDRGPSHPFLDTVVYENGRVVHKRSTSYEEFAAAASKDRDSAEQLHERLSQQHREVIAELEAGTLALAQHVKPNAKPAETEQAEALDVRLMNPNSWLASGEATLEIVLQTRKSRQEVADAAVDVFLEREKERVHCVAALTDAGGAATLKFSMPPKATEGASLVIRATDGTLYGELRFRLKAKVHGSASTPVSK